MQATLRPRRRFWLAFGLSAFVIGVATGVVLTLHPQLLSGLVIGTVVVLTSSGLGYWLVRHVRTRQLADYPDSGPGDGGGLAGIREPRSPHPPEGEDAIALLPPGASSPGRNDLAS